MTKFKGKVGATASVLVILLSFVLYLLIILPWGKRVQATAESDVKRGAELVRQSLDLQSHVMVSIAKEAASGKAFVEGIQQEAGIVQRNAIYKAITAFDNTLKQKRRKADFLGVVDATGKVIARDLSIQDMHGEKMDGLCIAQALKGHAASDIWLMKNRMVRAAAAPILVQGQVKGAVVVSFDITDAEAMGEYKNFSSHVVYFVDGVARATSFPKAGARVKAINSRLLTDSGKAAAASKSGKISDIFAASFGGADYLGMAGPLPPPVTMSGGQASDKTAGKTTVSAKHTSGFLVLVNVTKRMAQVKKARWTILGFMIIFALFVWAMMWWVAKHFVDAQDQLELGVSEVISGDMEYTFEVLEEFEGLANALNVMLARLLGRPEPGEDEEDDQSWRPDVLTILPFDGATDAQLGAEVEESYYAALHESYVAARQAAGLSVDGITLAWFSQKAKANEAMLAAKHKCAGIRFQVDSSSGQVGLKPFSIG